jgi:hypothetical protein
MLKPVPGQASRAVAEGHFATGRGGGDAASSRSAKTDRKVLEALAKMDLAGTTFAKWHKATGLPKSTFKDARTRLLEEGKVIQDGYGYRIATEGPEAEIRPDQGSPPLAA